MTIKNRIKYGVADLEKAYGPLTFGKLLLAHREGEEIGQEEMAHLLGISRQSLCDLEKGRRIPTPKRAAEIAQKLGMLSESFITLALQDRLREDHLDYEVSLARLKKKKAS